MKYIGRIVVGLVVLAVILAACYQCLRMANEKADEKIKSKAAELVIDYAKRDVDLAYAYRKADAEFAAQLKGVADTNAKLAKDMAEGLLSMKTAVVNSNSALEAVAKTDKEVVSLKQRLAVVEDKLSKPAVAETKPAAVAKAKPVVKKPAVVAKKPVKKSAKKMVVKKPAKVVKPCKGTKVTVTNGVTTVDVYVNIITKKPAKK